MDRNRHRLERLKINNLQLDFNGRQKNGTKSAQFCWRGSTVAGTGPKLWSRIR